MLYEGEKFLGHILPKAAGKFEVQCLQKPYRIQNALQFELDAIYNHQVYKAPIKPWATELDDDVITQGRPSTNIELQILTLGYKFHIVFPLLFGT